MLQRIGKFLNENIYTLGLFFSLLFCSCNAFAVYDKLAEAGQKIADGLGKVIYPAATIGISCVCIGGMFGNFNWKWLIAILLGLFVIAYSASVGDLATGADMAGAG